MDVIKYMMKNECNKRKLNNTLKAIGDDTTMIVTSLITLPAKTHSKSSFLSLNIWIRMIKEAEER